MKNEVVKERVSPLRKIINSSVAGCIIGGGLGLVDGLLGTEMFSSSAFPLAYGATNVIYSENSKELGIFQGPAEGVSAWGGFMGAYFLGKGIGGYIKK